MRYLYDNEGNVYCAIESDNLPYWHHTDIRGSVTNVLKGDSGTSSSPTLIRSYVYNAYGDTDYSIFTGGETFNANSYLAYTGAILDQETGLYYLMSRYYDPKAGSFISQDSYKGEGDAFWHLYAYCDGDPVNYIDRTGHAKRTAYIIYCSYYFERQSNSERKFYRDRCNANVIKYSVATVSQFVSKWNKMKNPSFVSLIFHGGAHAMEINRISSKEVLVSHDALYKTKHYSTKTIRNWKTTNSLKKFKSIQVLRMLSCNAGHKNHKKDNLASAFKKKIGGKVFASDGNVSFYYGSMYSPRLSYNQRGFENAIKSFGYRMRKPTGFYYL